MRSMPNMDKIDIVAISGLIIMFIVIMVTNYIIYFTPRVSVVKIKPYIPIKFADIPLQEN